MSDFSNALAGAVSISLFSACGIGQDPPATCSGDAIHVRFATSSGRSGESNGEALQADLRTSTPITVELSELRMGTASNEEVRTLGIEIAPNNTCRVVDQVSCSGDGCTAKIELQQRGACFVGIAGETTRGRTWTCWEYSEWDRIAGEEDYRAKRERALRDCESLYRQYCSRN